MPNIVFEAKILANCELTDTVCAEIYAEVIPATYSEEKALVSKSPYFPREAR